MYKVYKKKKSIVNTFILNNRFIDLKIKKLVGKFLVESRRRKSLYQI